LVLGRVEDEGERYAQQPDNGEQLPAWVLLDLGKAREGEDRAPDEKDDGSSKP
jgi:hypothetical protein